MDVWHKQCFVWLMDQMNAAQPEKYFYMVIVA